MFAIFSTKKHLYRGIYNKSTRPVPYWALHTAETDLCATVIRTGCILAYNSLTPAHCVAEFWRQAVSCARRKRGRGRDRTQRTEVCYEKRTAARCNNCTCVCVCASGSFLQAELPSSSSCWVCGVARCVRFLSASECSGSSFSAKHEAEHHRSRSRSRCRRCHSHSRYSRCRQRQSSPSVVGVVVSVVAVVVVVVIAGPVAAKFVCCF